VVAAAESLFVHQNTFRYRLRRVAEVGRIDLGDPDQRFAAMLQLRVLSVDESHGRTATQSSSAGQRVAQSFDTIS
jgi:hypothetical protein